MTDLFGEYWRRVGRADSRVIAIIDHGADGTPHYSRQTPGSKQAAPPGRVLTLLGEDLLAVWIACENLDPAGGRQWRVTVFRRLPGAPLASELVRMATAKTFEFWRRRYGGCPSPLRTEVDPRRVRKKRDPGRCFLRAGWRRVADRRGRVVLEVA